MEWSAQKITSGPSSMTEPKIIVLHALREDSRATTINHAACFGRYILDYQVEYVNIFGIVPQESASDLVIVTYELVALRNLPIWSELVKRMTPILRNSKMRVLMPQDDYSRSDVLDDFIVGQNFDFVFSPITRDLEQLYPQSMGRGVKFHEAFTGYFQDSDWIRLQSFSKPFEDRSVDLGQRVRHLPPQLGEKAGQKGRLAIEFGQLALQVGFTCDVSTRAQDVFLGDNWWKFLGNSKFTVSRKGGASMADPDGDLADKVRRYQMRHPNATMEQISRRLSFKGGREGDFSAISPRLFEAAALGVCQILEPDHYVDGFEPWVHYIPLAEEFSNVDEVFRAMKDVKRCTDIIQASQELLLQSNDYSYDAFVRRVCEVTNLNRRTEFTYISCDSSDLYHSVIGQQFESIYWVQGYVRRAFLKRKLKDAIKSLQVGKLLVIDTVDAKWADHAEANSESLLLWLESFSKQELLLESYVIPWRTMSSLINQ